MAALLRALVALAAMATVPPFAVAANYNVGGPGGSWDLSTDFTGWVSGKKFRVGDTLSEFTCFVFFFFFFLSSDYASQLVEIYMREFEVDIEEQKNSVTVDFLVRLLGLARANFVAGFLLSLNLCAFCNLLDSVAAFKHAANQHDVLEVSRAAYATCATSNPISTDAGGNTVVKLTAAGKRYFICGIQGHCSGGMKVKIDVLAAASLAASPAPSSSPPGSSLAAAPSSPSRRSPTDATSAGGSSDALPPSKPTTTAVASGGAPAKAVAGFGSGLLMLAVLIL